MFTILLPLHAHAADMYIEAPTTTVRTGDEVIVTVRAESVVPMNALEGVVHFSPAVVRIRDIRDGNSLINFWVERPQISTEGSIHFSGITPGGVVAKSNTQVFTIVFEALEAGVSPITLSDAKIFSHDGEGTLLPVRVRGTVVTVHQGGVSSQGTSSSALVVDTDPPETFTPLIVQDPSLFEGQAVIVFATQDKGSGIAAYAVREGWWGAFATATSPYRLQRQELDTRIVVKAIDKKGNERFAVVAPLHPQFWYEHYLFLGILVIALLGGVIYKTLWPKFTGA